MAEPRLLLRSQANAVFEAIRQNGMNPAEFDWKEESREEQSEEGPYIAEFLTLVHEPTGYSCEFRYMERNSLRGLLYSPGAEGLNEVRSGLTWGQQLYYAGLWLANLERETTAPDLWATISQEKALIEAASSPSEENKLFNRDELRYIGQQLNEIKEFLFKTQGLSEVHRKFVEDRLGYLAEAAGRVGRVDWKTLLAGTLVQIAVGAALNSDATRDLLRFAWTALGQLFGGTPALP